jgi:hypothetical protein
MYAPHLAAYGGGYYSTDGPARCSQHRAGLVDSPVRVRSAAVPIVRTMPAPARSVSRPRGSAVRTGGQVAALVVAEPDVSTVAAAGVCSGDEAGRVVKSSTVAPTAPVLRWSG